MTPIALPGLVDPHDLSADRQFSMNLARGLQVLRAFTAQEPVLGNRDIAARTGLPKATVSRITYTLTLMGYLARDASQKRYCLGPGVLSLGHPLLASMTARQQAGPLMDELARQTGCTVNLAMRDRDQAVYLATVRADASNPHLPDIGSTRPILFTAVGRALVLGASEPEQVAILNHLRVQAPQQFAEHWPVFDSDRQRFAQAGYCQSDGDPYLGIHAVAMPLYRQPGEPLLAMNCTRYGGPSAQDHLVNHALPLLRRVVKQYELAHVRR
ncbi:IclR family transcriptional regulator [Comamonas serinivorans]|uniref:IclR family transcriptional regulator n=1 Tax=Comamonas serinivorans TaxID=1082851 RepID=A0A1Y0ELP0_9BURK|nr:IclR family transcriptional regulator [Comamonas serinivorans]ARU04527.1 IclR family transcriptional regulator [Comamonas serinivorans]